jgi:hypothetical protein
MATIITTSDSKFKIEYTLLPAAGSDPDVDIQFGMDFTLSCAIADGKIPLCQLILPATGVGKNLVGQWNVDNARAISGQAADLAYKSGPSPIIDTPRELSKRNKGILTTMFAVFPLLGKTIYNKGVSFGYTVDTTADNPVTTLSNFKPAQLSAEQQRLISATCTYITFQ